VGASFDSDVGVQRRGELTEWMPRDPLLRVENSLIALGVTDLEDRRAAIEKEVAGALDQARRAPVPSAEGFLDHVTAPPLFGPEPYDFAAQEAACAH